MDTTRPSARRRPILVFDERVFPPMVSVSGERSLGEAAKMNTAPSHRGTRRQH